jgi:hypothetical protein
MAYGNGRKEIVLFFSKTCVSNIFRYDKDLANHARIKLKISAEKCLHQSGIVIQF